MSTEADYARTKLDAICDYLRDEFHVGDPIWDLLDGVYDDVNRLERKAYIIIPKPRWLRRGEAKTA